MKNKINILIPLLFTILFVLWTMLTCFVDVKNIGPLNSAVGLSTINGHVKDFFGHNFFLYVMTDWLGLVPIMVAVGFAVLGFIQLVKRRSLVKVDLDILLLGVFYIVVFGLYVLFEYVSINFRPVLINGVLEKSYPSSTTLLTLTVIPTAILQFDKRVKNNKIRLFLKGVMVAFSCFMVLGRLISGVHWLSDIVGGILLSLILTKTYQIFVKK